MRGLWKRLMTFFGVPPTTIEVPITKEHLMEAQDAIAAGRPRINSCLVAIAFEDVVGHKVGVTSLMVQNRHTYVPIDSRTHADLVRLFDTEKFTALQVLLPLTLTYRRTEVIEVTELL